MKAWFLLLVTIIFNAAYGQHVEWLDAIQGDAGSKGSTQVSVDIDKENNAYFLGNLDNQQLGTTTATKRTLVKYTKNGEKCWHKNFDYEVITVNTDEDSCNLYSLVYIDTVTTIGMDTYYASKGNYK